jgi:hypothetical protein
MTRVGSSVIMNRLINVSVLLSEDATVAEARGSTLSNIGELSGTGAAKKHPKDTPEPEVGFNLAVARALRSLADQYEKRAEQAHVFYDGTVWTSNTNSTVTVKR